MITFQSVWLEPNIITAITVHSVRIWRDTRLVNKHKATRGVCDIIVEPGPRECRGWPDEHPKRELTGAEDRSIKQYDDINACHEPVKGLYLDNGQTNVTVQFRASSFSLPLFPLTPLLTQVPHRHPKRPLTIWIAQSTSWRLLVTNRVEKSPTLNSTTFLGSMHQPHMLWSLR